MIARVFLMSCILHFAFYTPLISCAARLREGLSFVDSISQSHVSALLSP